MRRSLGYLLAWVVATSVAVAGSWVGLQPLLAAAAVERPPSLEIQHLREMATADPSGTPSPPPATVTPTPTLQDSPSPPPPPSPAPAQPPPASPSPPPATAGSSDWEQVPGSRAVQRTFVVQGGVVVFEASRRGVQVVDYEPNPGFDVSINRGPRGSMAITFSSDAHTSRVWVQWRNRPYTEITESA